MATKTKSDYKYKFSFVMPVYNVEDYLAEAIESILAQTLDFEANCELILINDGSPDGSEEVCLRYKEQFPNNIKYIKQENMGVSVARNRGMDEARGKYISFVDSDDRISPDTLKTVYSFFQKNYSRTDVVAIPMIFFGSSNASHPLNDKFEQGDRVINLEHEYQYRQFSSSSAFFKAEAVQTYRFDPRLIFVEDGKFVSRVLADKLTIGVVAKPIYYYRRRHDNSSAVNNMVKAGAWYFDTPEYYWLELIAESKKIHGGKLPKYVQSILVYELRWRFTQKQLNLDETQRKRYVDIISLTLKDIDDKIIIECAGVYPEYRINMLSKKYGHDIINDLIYREDGGLYYGDVKVYEAENNVVHLDFIKSYDESSLTLEGWYGGFKNSDYEVYLEVNGRKVAFVDSYQPYTKKYSLGEAVYSKRAFTVEVPMGGDTVDIRPVMVIANAKFYIHLELGRHTRLHRKTFSFCRIKTLLVKSIGDALVVYKYSSWRHLGLELMYLAVLCRSGYFKVVALRLSQYIFKLIYYNKKVWLISDRADKGGDNGTYLFRYASSVKEKVCNPYLAINKNTAYYSELKRDGKVVNHGSFIYKQLFLLADKVVSSHFDEYVVNPFGSAYIFYHDLQNSDFVYLEHGVLTGDLSFLINRFTKNIGLLTASSEKETQAIIKDRHYAYDSEVVKTTGHPRFDGLNNRPQNRLVFMPTWRLIAASNQNIRKGVSDGTRNYNKHFKLTDYFIFYDKLINDKRVIDALVNKNMTAEFYIHPNHMAQWRDFHGNDTVTIMQPPHNYEKGLSEGSIMVTDYSGVAFDFAYMGKPVVYAQFDKGDFYKNHTYSKSYFSFEKDGFGPVANNYEATVKEIIKIIQSGCVTEPKYKERAKRFFYRIDSNNSKRVYDAIVDMDK